MFVINGTIYIFKPTFKQISSLKIQLDSKLKLAYSLLFICKFIKPQLRKQEHRIKKIRKYQYKRWVNVCHMGNNLF